MPQKLIVITVLLLCISLFSDDSQITIRKVHGTQIYLTGSGIIPGQSYLVFSKKGDFKGEVKVLKREKSGYYLAKETERAIAGFSADSYRKDDHLVKFLNYDLKLLKKAPLFYAGEYFRLSGELEKIECFAENLLYFKFRRRENIYYTPQKQRQPFGNYYAKTDQQYLGSFFIVLFSADELESMPVVGKQYVVYGRYADSRPYDTFEGLRLIQY